MPDLNCERKLHILIAEDNLGDVVLAREALEQEQFLFELDVQRNGEQVMLRLGDCGNAIDATPDLVLLDLNLPRVEGIEILRKIRESSRWRQVPVVILTSSDSPYDRESAEREGADAYFRKPSDYDEFMELGKVIRQVLGG